MIDVDWSRAEIRTCFHAMVTMRGNERRVVDCKSPPLYLFIKVDFECDPPTRRIFRSCKAHGSMWMTNGRLMPGEMRLLW